MIPIILKFFFRNLLSFILFKPWLPVFFPSALIRSKLHAKYYVVENNGIIVINAQKGQFLGTNIVIFHQKLSTLEGTFRKG